MPSNQLIEPDLYQNLLALPEAWQQVMQAEPVPSILRQLTCYLTERLKAGAVIYPAEPFRALKGLTPTDIKVVILGQDPYHGPEQAQGLAFSVPDHQKRPPSLRNIFLEIEREFPLRPEGAQDANITSYRFDPSKMGSPAQGRLDIGPAAPGNDLSRWASQGVLLLNTVLTVEDGKPASHAKAGWEAITDALIAAVACDPSPKVFMLWGAHAQAKRALITDQSNHLVLCANHPSPLSARRGPAPFLGCGHFAAANVWLLQQNRTEICWNM
jgi:uracil-DNA glycosylase